jgi:hypothetical protein
MVIRPVAGFFTWLICVRFHDHRFIDVTGIIDIKLSPCWHLIYFLAGLWACYYGHT